MTITSWVLKQKQSLPLKAKIQMSNKRIKEWYDNWGGQVYVSFSGGKDSTVLLHMVRKLYPKVVGVFVDTGLEYPEIRKFVKTINNVIWLKPKMNFKEVLEKYGYPVISKENAQKIEEIRNTKSDKLRNKRLYGDEKGYGKLPEKWKPMLDAPFLISGKCCNVMKKAPMKRYEKDSGQKPFVGLMASDSSGRKTSYLRNGCNAYTQRPMSNPLGFWMEKDVWKYIKKYDLEISKIYRMGYPRTGCMFCMFGVHLEPLPTRFQRMKKTHPKLYKYCIEELGCGEVLDYIGIDY